MCCGMMSCDWFPGDMRTGNVVGHEMSCYAMSCEVMWCDVVSCHVVSCHVVWCEVMWCNGMGCYVMSWDLVVWCVEWWCAVNYGGPMSQQNLWDVHSNERCNLGMQDTRRLRRAHVTELRLGTTKNYYILQCSTLLRYYSILQSITHITPYYQVLLRYYSELQITTPHRRTTNKVLLCYYPVLQTMCYSGTTPYYLQYTEVTHSHPPTLPNTACHDKWFSCLILLAQETSSTMGRATEVTIVTTGTGCATLYSFLLYVLFSSPLYFSFLFSTLLCPNDRILKV